MREYNRKVITVLVPYIRLSPHTVAALDAYSPIYVETLGPFGYIDALEREWAQNRGFCLVEQDKVPWPGALDEIWRCPRDWCVFPCKMRQTDQPADFPTLSTVKFGWNMVSSHPDFMQRVRSTSVGDKPAGHYSRLDMAIYDIAARLRITPHWHEPAVEHRHQEEES